MRRRFRVKAGIEPIFTINIFYKLHCPDDIPRFLCFHDGTFAPQYIFIGILLKKGSKISIQCSRSANGSVIFLRLLKSSEEDIPANPVGLMIKAGNVYGIGKVRVLPKKL